MFWWHRMVLDILYIIGSSYGFPYQQQAIIWSNADLSSIMY